MALGSLAPWISISPFLEGEGDVDSTQPASGSIKCLPIKYQVGEEQCNYV